MRGPAQPGWLAVVAIVALAAFAGGWALYAWWETPPTPRELTQQLNATVFPADYGRVADFALDTADRPVTRSDLAGQWSFLFFGFTNCADICPTTLQRLSAATERIGDTRTPVPRVLFVAVDYRRDTPQSASRYARRFNPTFVGATGEQAALRRLADSVNAPFKVPEAPESADYMVEHSAAIFLLDPAGRIRALFSSSRTLSPQTIATEYRRIREMLDRNAH